MVRMPSTLLGFALTLTLAGSALAQTPAPDPAVPAVAPAAPAQAPAVAEPAAAAVVETPQLSEAVLKAVGPMEDGKARIVFYRPSKFAGGGVGFIVRENDKELGKLRNGKYFVINVEPGKHAFVVHTEATDNLSLEVEPGKTYFVAGSISMGFMVGRPHLAAADAASFEALLPKLDQVKPLS